jgi:cell division protein FtsZ
MAEILPDIETFARIKVVGIGGGGGNALNRMVQSKLRGIDFVAINTDAQALHYSQANKKVHIGKEATNGLGAGANPDIGRQAAEENEAEIYEALKNSEMVFITVGTGGGTGTGAAPVVARIAREIGALTVGIVTKPFTFEGDRRRKVSEQGIEDLRDKVDTLIVIPNDRILQIIDRKTSLLDAFGAVDDVLKQGVQGIADLITVNGLVNLDFADVKSIMSEAGSALMGIGQGAGDTRAIDAVKQAMDSPLLEVSISGAKGVLINFTGGRDMGMHEIEEAAKLVHDSVDPEANIIFGTVIDENITGEVRVTLVATGFESDRFGSMVGFGSASTRSEDTAPSFTSPAPTSAQASASEFETRQDHNLRVPFLRREKPQPIVDTDTVPMIQAEPEDAIKNTEPVIDEEMIGFELDENLLDKESAEPQIDKSEPIVETVAPSFSEDDDDDLDKPAFLRHNRKVSGQDNDDDIPAFIKRKL